MKGFKTVKGKIAFTYVLVFVGTLMLLNILIYFLSLNMILGVKKDILYTNRSFFLEKMEAHRSGERAVSKGEIENEIDKVRMESNRFYIRVEARDGRKAGRVPEGIVFEERYDEVILADGEGQEEYLYLMEFYEHEGENYKVTYVLVTDYEEYFKILIRVLALVELLGVAIAVVMGVKVGDKVVGPINEISAMTERINGENLNERLPLVEGQHEIARLSTVINLMLERLDKTFEDQKRFISNVSHELRTPIAVMKGYLDLYRKVGPGNREIVDEAIRAIEEENENMKTMIEKLLFLAKKESREYPLNMESIDVKQLLEKLKRDYSSIEGGRAIEINAERNSRIVCDQNLVLQMLRALIDNAIKYGEGNEIRLGYCKEDGEAVVYVRDFGVGMSEDEIGHIFEGFYKGDESRNRDDGSMGLGLSIVEKIAQIHRCRVEVESELGRGSVFKVVFPGGVVEDEEDTYSRG